MRRTPVVFAAAALALAVTGGTTAHADVTDTTVVTTVSGLLTLTGTGASLSVDAQPGAFSPAVGGAALTVSDLRGTSAGWTVTATYTAPTVGTPLGGGNMKVSATSLTTEITGVDLKPAADQPLSSPVTMATTGLDGGLGITEFVASYKIQAPSTAAVGEAFGATVTYTLASIR